MKNLLVYGYFCPAASHRPGGVQQVAPGLLDALAQSHGWSIGVVHTGPCASPSEHHAIADPVDANQSDCVEPGRLVEAARRLRELIASFDVVLSIDRVLPARPSIPAVLMSNTLCYQTESWAVVAGGWERIVAPTRHFASRIRSVVPSACVAVVPYGLPEPVVGRLLSMPPPAGDDRPLVVRLPHRPDRRKGHRAAIVGLAGARPASRDTHLEIAWLQESRYAAFRSELEALAVERGVVGQVTFTPWLDGDERWKAVARASAALLPGEFEETFGLAAVESVLAGRLAMTSRQPAIDEVLGGHELHVQLDDPLDWHRALPRRRERLDGVAAAIRRRRALAGQLALDAMAARYDRLLTGAAGGR